MTVARLIKIVHPIRPTARLGIGILFVTFLILGLANTTEVWTKGHHGWNGSRRSTEAINYLNFGYLQTKLIPLDNEETLGGRDAFPTSTEEYKHHPPFTMIYLSWVYWLFGKGEAQARLGFLFVSCLTFWLLYGAFRRVVSERFALVAMTAYTFMPIQATNLNFVNFELLVLLAMACTVYGYERLRERFSYRWCVLMAVGVFIGTFSDYPALTFSGFFYVYAALQTWMMRGDKKDSRINWVIGLGYPVWQLICASGLAWIFLTWRESSRSLFTLYKRRGSSTWGSLESLIFDHWEGFVDFFTPVVYLLVFAYLLDLLYRVIKRRLGRIDGLILVYFVNSGTLLFILQKWFKHNYAALYFVPMLALAAAAGLEGILRLLGGRRKAALFVVGFCFVSMVAYAMPVIHNRRVSPSSEYVDPVYFRHADQLLDFDEYWDLLASAAHRIAAPGERSIYSRFGKAFRRLYYLRHVNEEYTDPIVVRTSKAYGSAYLIRQTKASDGLLKPWLTKTAHLRVGEFSIFDWKGEMLEHTEVLIRAKERRSDVARYFSSMVRTKTTLVRDDWRSLDYNLKLGRDKDVAYYRDLIRKGAPVRDSLYAAIALYNNKLAYGKAGSLSPVISRLRKAKGDRALAPGVELVGFRLKRDNGGRHIATVVVRPTKPLVGNFGLRWRTDFRSPFEPSWYRKRMRKAKRQVSFDTPSYQWKPGWIYFSEFDLSVPYERYRLRIGLKKIGDASLADPKTSEVWFRLRCRKVGPRTISRYLKHPKVNEFPKIRSDIRLGEHLQIERCAIGQIRRRKPWRVVLQVSETERLSKKYHFTLMAQQKKKKYLEAEVKFYPDIEEWQSGESRPIAFYFPDELKKRPRYLWLNVTQPAKKTTRLIELTTEPLGRRFVFHWLVKADIYRFWLRNLLF